MDTFLENCSQEEYIEYIVKDLEGTCKTLDIEHYIQRGFSEDALNSGIDDVIFLCSCCNWWCEVGDSNEQDGENVCGDCYEEED